MSLQLHNERIRHQFLLQALGVTRKSKATVSNRERSALESLLLGTNAEVVFLLGVGAVQCIHELLRWVDEKEIRELVMLEESLEAVNGFLDVPFADMFIEHPRCSLKVKMPSSTRKEYLEEVAEEFASDAVECIAFGEMEAFREEYEYQLRKDASFEYFGLQEDVEYHRLVENIVGNIPAVSRATLFDNWGKVFDGATVIICGAGPSLAEHYDVLKKAKDDFPIIAGGSAIALLTNEGIIPDLGVAVDPNETELDRLSELDPKMPLIFSGRLHPGVLKQHSGPVVYYTARTGGPFENGIIDALGLSFDTNESALFQSTTIASMCIEVACRLGCNKAILVGFDLAFSGGERYPKKLPKKFGEVSLPKERSHQKVLFEPNRHNAPVETTVLWKMERDALARLVAARQEHSFASLPHDGLVLPGVPFVASLPEEGAPFREKLERAISTNTHAHSGKIEAYLSKVKKSLACAKGILERISAEIEKDKPKNPLIDVLLMDLHEEFAYEIFLKTTMATLERLIERKIYDFKSLKNKCLYLIKLINTYIDILN